VFLRCLLLLSSVLLPAAIAIGADDPNTATCKEFVYLDDGQLKLEGEPFGLKGVNLTAWIGAAPDQPDSPDSYFLIPYWSYRPQNFSLRIRGTQPQAETCSTEASCRSMFSDEHVSRIAGLGANSVRLTGLGVRFYNGPDVPEEEKGNAYFPARCLWRQGGDGDPVCKMDLTKPALRARYLEIVREAINILGEHGMRTILHTGHASAITDDGFEAYIDWLEEVAQAFAEEPYLLAYDPLNEPMWIADEEFDHPSFGDACDYIGNRPLCKGLAQRVSKAWFDALTAHDPQHLVTIGLANAYHSSRVWDPSILWDHFTSYHFYADGVANTDEWREDNGFSESWDFANLIYMASLSGCGLPCPYVGTYDGANCLVAKGQAGQAGSIADGGFFYAPRSSGNPCPGGTLEAAGCRVGDYDPGRDEPWMTTAPTYYVEPSSTISANNGCPRSTTFDGSNCVVAQGPPGATGFIADGAFYYSAFTGNQDPCAPNHVNEGNRCRVATIPTVAGPAFVMHKALFYVESVACGPRKPLHFGEIGFTTYRDGVTAEPCPFGGTLDDTGCLLATPPLGRPTRYDSATRSFSYFRSNDLCPNPFKKDGKWCKLSANAATNVLLEKPLYYVHPINGQCPPGITPDSLGCRVAEGPMPPNSTDGFIPVQPFEYQGNFYYSHLDPAGVHCALPGQDDTANCLVAPVPSGYTPFITSQAYFYRERCSYDGPDSDAVDFLVGGSTPNWPGVVPYAHNCGFQGLHWWTLADVHNYACRETNSLFAHWDTRLPFTPLDPSWLVEKALVPHFRQGVDFTAPPAEKCEKPARFHSAPDRRTFGGGRYIFQGSVKDQFGAPVPNAVVRVWESHPTVWHQYSYWTTTDSQGNYEVETRYCLESVSAPAFGHELSDDVAAIGYDPANCTLTPGTYSGPDVSIFKLAPAGLTPPSTPPYYPEVLNTTLLDPPSTRRVACQVNDQWTLQP